MQGRKHFESIDEYIKTFPPDVQKTLEKMRRTIRKAVPEAEEAISYQIPAFKLNGDLVYFAAFKKHIGFFPTSSGISAFKKELWKYKTSRGTAQFPLDQPLPRGNKLSDSHFQTKRRPSIFRGVQETHRILSNIFRNFSIQERAIEVQDIERHGTVST